MSKLKASPLVDPENLVDIEFPQTKELRFLAWGMKSPSGKWDNSQWNGKIAYESGDSDKPVKKLGVSTPDLCLGEIIAAYGQPDLLYLPPYAILGEADLIWKSHGLLFNTVLSDPGAEISSGACGGSINLVSNDVTLTEYPQIAIFVLGISSAADDFTAWKGYGKYPSKYTDMALTDTP